ncbi:hypothetical protein EVAR_92956_1 [Eumeta japonica]|uniref:Uncharacterized protein n=1 Tax=Eumeta variegata TaxID=151549 RepID=A0A4C1TAC6_EUMVA|nr:hypothetical protein EVAR_92956_1 [Eumeta japonica]
MNPQAPRLYGLPKVHKEGMTVSYPPAAAVLSNIIHHSNSASPEPRAPAARISRTRRGLTSNKWSSPSASCFP